MQLEKSKTETGKSTLWGRDSQLRSLKESKKKQKLPINLKGESDYYYFLAFLLLLVPLLPIVPFPLSLIASVPISLLPHPHFLPRIPSLSFPLILSFSPSFIISLLPSFHRSFLPSFLPCLLPSPCIRLERQQAENKDVENRADLLGRTVSKKREDMMSGDVHLISFTSHIFLS